MKSLRKIAKEINISAAYLCDVVNGKKSCSNEMMNKIKKYYPYLQFELYKPRYKIIKK